MEPHTGRVILLRTDNWFLHLYETPDEMIAQGDVASEDVTFDMFDTEGYRLTPGYAPDWSIKVLYRAAGDPRPEAVCRRLRAWVRHMRSGTRAISDTELLELLRQHLPVVGDDAAEAIRLAVKDLPDLTDVSLSDCYDMLLEHVTFTPGDLGTPYHIWQHLNGKAHK
ncbi:hypothetical protein [Virgisporangium aliadipatigenens]|nr:hypothetical protein [Virgisporangium aliadipatigenens]